jgi:hypothetical protein
MKCKRCGCTNENPCRVRLARGSVDAPTVMHCSWVIDELCSNCLTNDEQRIIASMVDSVKELRGELDDVDAKRLEWRNILFTRVLPAFAGSTGTVVTVEQAVRLALQLAEAGAEALVPEPESEPLIEIPADPLGLFSRGR